MELVAQVYNLLQFNARSDSPCPQVSPKLVGKVFKPEERGKTSEALRGQKLMLRREYNGRFDLVMQLQCENTRAGLATIF